MNNQCVFYFGDKVKFLYKGRTIYGIVKKINRKSVTINTVLGRFRVTSNGLVHVNISEWNLNSKNQPFFSTEIRQYGQNNDLFKIGDKVNFTYKGELVYGVVEKINRKTIRVQSQIGRFRASPSRLNLESSSIQDKIKPRPKEVRKWSNTQQSDYNISNMSRIAEIPYSLLEQTHNITRLLTRALNERNDFEISKYSNELISILSMSYKLPTVKIHTGGKRIINRRNQMLGVHRTRDLGKKTQRSSISVFSRTAKRQQYVKPKTFLRTLIHEFMHHFDRYNLELVYEYHTKGFYNRVTTVYNQLKVVITE